MDRCRPETLRSPWKVCYAASAGKLHLGAGLPARADPAEARSPLRSVGNGEKWTRQTSVAPEYRFRRVKSRIDCAGGSSPGSAEIGRASCRERVCPDV